MRQKLYQPQLLESKDIMLKMVTQNKFDNLKKIKPYSNMCNNCYGLSHLCNIQHYYDMCPCATCLIKSMCISECEERREFISKYGLGLRI